MKPHKVAALGMTKTFQNVALFAESSVLDNVLTAGLLRHEVATAREQALICLERVGLRSVAHKLAGDLSFPERRASSWRGRCAPARRCCCSTR